MSYLNIESEIFFTYAFFGCKSFVLNNGEDKLNKFSSKVDEVIFLGYSSSGNAYSGLNNRTYVV